MNLSEKKKVKDLFLVVIRAIDIDQNRAVVSSLIQFASNLCYGTGKFRRLLISAEAPTDFIATLSNILTSVQKPLDLAAAMQAAEEQKSNEMVSDEGKRVLLKATTLNFIGNLCVEAQLRQLISQDVGGLLTQVFTMFEEDVIKKPFDWIDSASRALQTLANCSIEPAGQNLMASKQFDKLFENVFKTLPVRPVDKSEKECIERILQLVGRLAKAEEGQRKILGSKDLMLRLIVYYTFEDTNKSALITLYTLMSTQPDFKTVCFDTHGFTLASFELFVKSSKENFKRSMET